MPGRNLFAKPTGRNLFADQPAPMPGALDAAPSPDMEQEYVPIPPVIRPPSTPERSIGAREAAIMSGAMGGGLLGATAGGPAAPVTGLLGMLAGGALGAAGGSLAAEVGEHIQSGKPWGIGEDVMGPTKRAAKEAYEDVLWSGGFSAAGPVLKQLGKPLVGRALGLMNKESAAITAKAQGMGVDIGAAHISPRAMVKGAPGVLGVFPFVGTPFREGQKRIVGQLDDAAADLLNTLAPAGTKYDVGAGITKKAGQRFKALNRIASSYYKRFSDVADGLSNPNIVDTDHILRSLEGIEARRAREAVPLMRGGELKGGADPLDDFLAQLDLLPERITINQARGIERQLNDITGRLGGKANLSNWDMSRINMVRNGLADAKNNLDVQNLSPGEAEVVTRAWDDANKFFSGMRGIAETPVGKQFGKFDKNIFNKSFFKSGTVNPDEMLRVAWNTKSPAAMEDLRNIIGDREYRKASRKWIEEAFEKAHVPPKEGSGLKVNVFSGDKFTNLLNLGTKDGEAVLEQALKGSDVTAKDFMDFLDVAKAAGDITVKNPSTFVARRAILGGGMLGSFAMGAGKISIPAAAFISWMARRGAKFLMNKEQLRLMTKVMKDGTPDMQRRNAFHRLVRAATEDDTAPAPFPVIAPPQTTGATLTPGLALRGLANEGGRLAADLARRVGPGARLGTYQAGRLEDELKGR